MIITLAGGSSICFDVCVFLAIAWVVAFFTLAPAFALDDEGSKVISAVIAIWGFSVFGGFSEGWMGLIALPAVASIIVCMNLAVRFLAFVGGRVCKVFASRK